MSRHTFRALRQLPGALLLAAVLALVPLAGAQPPSVGRRSARPAPRLAADSARIQSDIAYLADDRLEGRLTGSPGNDSAAAFIARRFRQLGLRAIVVDTRTARPSFAQRFTARVSAFAHAGRPFELPTQNVVAMIPGRDPALRGQVVVLGAHYDHLGRDTIFAADPRAGAVIHNGADDNASGTAAVLELARLLVASPPRRSVLLVAFSGEEEGVLGSQWFVEHPPVPLDSMVAMLNFDMVGRLANDRLLVYGVATADELPALVDSANAAGPRLAVRALGDGAGPSDHASFYLKGMPVLHFFTDQHPDYHAATDDVDRINAAGEARVVTLAETVARSIADRPARLTFRRAPARMASGSASGEKPYLGSIPDMGADAQGMRLAGVTAGSPAEKGGLRAGDIVVEFDGKPVTDLYSYNDALTARKPGDAVTIVVQRGEGAAAQRVTLSVTLGRRGE